MKNKLLEMSAAGISGIEAAKSEPVTTDIVARAWRRVRATFSPHYSDLSAIPISLEKRRHPRLTVDWPANLLGGVVDTEVCIHDISVGGCCLYTEEALAISEKITLELRSGRRLIGQVVWVRQGSYGIQLAVELTDDDEIMVAARSQEGAVAC